MHENNHHKDEGWKKISEMEDFCQWEEIWGGISLWGNNQTEKQTCGPRKKRAVKFGKSECVRRRRNQHVWVNCESWCLPVSCLSSPRSITPFSFSEQQVSTGPLLQKTTELNRHFDTLLICCRGLWRSEAAKKSLCCRKGLVGFSCLCAAYLFSRNLPLCSTFIAFTVKRLHKIFQFTRSSQFQNRVWL